MGFGAAKAAAALLLCAGAAPAMVAPEVLDVAIVGCGPAGIQSALEAQRHGLSYVVLERSGRCGSFFEKYPKGGRLISFNKRHVPGMLPGWTEEHHEDYALRFDWHSLRHTKAGFPSFRNRTMKFNPAASELVDYLQEVVAAHDINVRYNRTVTSVSRLQSEVRADGAVSDRTFQLELGSGETLAARAVVLASGLGLRNVRDADRYRDGRIAAFTYEDAPTDCAAYTDKWVVVAGNGNSGMEMASYIIAHCAATRVWVVGKRPVTPSHFSHYVGGVRNFNLLPLESYLLKSLDVVLEADATSQEFHARLASLVGGDFSRVVMVYASGFKAVGPRTLVADETNGTDAFSDASLDFRRYPRTGPFNELRGGEGVYVAGTIAHGRDYRESAGGFVHGFRYTVGLTMQRIANRAKGGGEVWPYRHFDGVEDLASHTAIRLQSSSALWHLESFYCDLLIDTGLGGTLYVEGIPTGSEMDMVTDEVVAAFRATLPEGQKAALAEGWTRRRVAVMYQYAGHFKDADAAYAKDRAGGGFISPVAYVESQEGFPSSARDAPGGKRDWTGWTMVRCFEDLMARFELGSDVEGPYGHTGLGRIVRTVTHWAKRNARRSHPAAHGLARVDMDAIYRKDAASGAKVFSDFDRLPMESAFHWAYEQRSASLFRGAARAEGMDWAAVVGAVGEEASVESVYSTYGSPVHADALERLGRAGTKNPLLLQRVETRRVPAAGLLDACEAVVDNKGNLAEAGLRAAAFGGPQSALVSNAWRGKVPGGVPSSMGRAALDMEAAERFDAETFPRITVAALAHNEMPEQLRERVHELMRSVGAGLAGAEQLADVKVDMLCGGASRHLEVDDRAHVIVGTGGALRVVAFPPAAFPSLFFADVFHPLSSSGQLYSELPVAMLLDDLGTLRADERGQPPAFCGSEGGAGTGTILDSKFEGALQAFCHEDVVDVTLGEGDVLLLPPGYARFLQSTSRGGEGAAGAVYATAAFTPDLVGPDFLARDFPAVIEREFYRVLNLNSYRRIAEEIFLLHAHFQRFDELADVDSKAQVMHVLTGSLLAGRGLRDSAAVAVANRAAKKLLRTCEASGYGPRQQRDPSRLARATDTARGGRKYDHFVHTDTAPVLRNVLDAGGADRQLSGYAAANYMAYFAEWSLQHALDRGGDDSGDALGQLCDALYALARPPDAPAPPARGGGPANETQS